ncbi:unnamed protein product [Blepharisma stoltei]|uniref:Protein disulfide-isomerase n=1 Tax=Blepharisma stoltei TaxID=1481888 RepID=A0AAU9JUM5_9CILI|nr:unnamed protein product [Blepharisma stoltei]
MGPKAILGFLLISLISAQIPEEDGVWVLSDINFNEALEKQPDLLVDFYAPWCGHCKQLAPEYARAAQALKERNPPIRIAKIDATQNPKLSQQFDINSYPTIKYFINKKPIDYNGERTKDSIISWVLTKSGSNIKIISSLSSLQTEIEKTKSAAVIFTQKSSGELKLFNEASKYFEGLPFIQSTDSSSAAFYNVKENDVVLFKKYDDRQVVFDWSSNGDLIEWIKSAKRPWVWRFDEETAEHLFKYSNPGLILFKSDSDSSLMSMFEKLGKELKSEILFIYADITRQENKRLGEYIGVAPRDMPCIYIIENNGNKKNKLDTYINEDSIRNFITNWKEGRLGIRSQPVAASPSGSKVKILTESNFDSIVNDSSKNVLVDFYAPWCGHCKALEPEIEVLASKITDDSIIIAKLDHTANNIRGHPISAYPTIKYFPAKDKKPLDYEGDRVWEALLQFVTDNASFKSPRTDL